jgi:hypothetical protein
VTGRVAAAEAARKGGGVPPQCGVLAFAVERREREGERSKKKENC